MRFSYRSFLLLALPSAPRPSFLQVLLLCCRLSFYSQSFFRAAALPSAPRPSFCSSPFLWACPSSVLQPFLLLPILLLCCRFCFWRGG